MSLVKKHKETHTALPFLLRYRVISNIVGKCNKRKVKAGDLCFQYIFKGGSVWSSAGSEILV